MELGAGDESDGNVAVGDGLGGTVFKNKEGRDMAAVDEFDFTVGAEVKGEEGNVLLAGDARAEEVIDGGEGVPVSAVQPLTWAYIIP